MSDLTDEEIDAIIERLRMLTRNVIANGRGEITIGKFVIGEDLPTGHLTVAVASLMRKRPYGAIVSKQETGRRLIMFVERDGRFMIAKVDRSLLKGLEQQMVLDELANI